jgi:alkanesulfonate monooxygenase SsuD/methylene tetrahydromethanopterin reductase-like flavin-dependent oxidoreductase (luciferase family)
MADYGHDLILGTSLSPHSRRPQEVAGLARLTERAGLDLVTFQDHPYQPRYLDAWTLLAYMAAQTERVRLAANVIDLSSRPLADLARAAASLDLLSCGRFELGISTGPRRDAIEAGGAPRRPPGPAVAALSQAIDIINGIWDTCEPGGMRLHTKRDRVHAPERGPRQAHDISIWVSASGPRMLRLTGEKADGWLTGLPRTTMSGLETGNQIIDEAAAAAGRDPREIRRLLTITGTLTAASRGFLHGPPKQWAEELLPLVIEKGFTAFILNDDDPRAIVAWGAEVVPALRMAVASERGTDGRSR